MACRYNDALPKPTIALLYVTTPDRKTAEFIANKLVSKRLIACANILGNISSIYRRKRKLRREKEVAMILKTTTDLVQRATKRIQALHPYECPCIVALPIVTGHRSFLRWIQKTVQ